LELFWLMVHFKAIGNLEKVDQVFAGLQSKTIPAYMFDFVELCLHDCLQNLKLSDLYSTQQDLNKLLKELNLDDLHLSLADVLVKLHTSKRKSFYGQVSLRDLVPEQQYEKVKQNLLESPFLFKLNLFVCQKIQRHLHAIDFHCEILLKDLSTNWVQSLLTKQIKSNLALEESAIEQILPHLEGMADCSDQRMFCFLHRVFVPF